ncbi:caspase family protein [Pseudomonas sp. PDM04]|uniref:caspase family protein n=1 Tax=Pseudomonas sp. PDM04 TaxID=2769296 RepID=UPI0017868262|nr:caspase family protein [Pseudomonas sp. PDM04]MBD9439412.1 caspase family protein [Pseudomonas sp. PDM04]
MPYRVLLSIGCNDYQNMNKLAGAETDANNIHSELTASALSCIKPEHSLLVLSPSLNDIREALEELQDRFNEIESLTIFFAGHGGVVNGSYYLCMCDTRNDRMSTTGLALSHLFEFINDIKAAHCNLIIDACEAGGMISDMGSLLKPEVIGKARSCGVSIFVSSASDQVASEDNSGGWGTTAILQILRGEADTGCRAPFLDLLDIGRAAAQNVSINSAGKQLPSVWGMNLYGPMPIFGNPHAATSIPSSLLQVTGISPTSIAGMVIGNRSSEVLGLMFAPASELTPEKLYDKLIQSIEPLEKIPGAAATFVESVWRSLEVSIKRQPNSFARVELTATCMSFLLSSATVDASSKNCIRRLAEDLFIEMHDVLQRIVDMLEENPKSLCRHGIPDLFYLPQRITRVLGWIGTAFYIAKQYGLDTAKLRGLAIKFNIFVADYYAASATGMSESEIPFLAVFLLTAKELGETEICELIISSLYNALIENEGALARPDLAPRDVLSYLHARAVNNLEAQRNLSSHPSESLAFVILMGEVLSLQDLINFNLELLDHSHFYMFIPNDHAQFSFPCVENGLNHVFQIGHGVWEVKDLVSRWRASCFPQLARDESLKITEVTIGALCSALIFPNRVPWYLFIGTALDPFQEPLK